VASAVGNFGSGWTWLVKKADGSVDIVNMGAAGTPDHRRQGAADRGRVGTRLLHRLPQLRPKFVETFFDKLVNWKFAEANFAA
jgi:Fe-Mn family superoxide dismutase